MKTPEEGREKQEVTASLTAAKYCRLAGGVAVSSCCFYLATRWYFHIKRPPRDTIEVFSC